MAPDDVLNVSIIPDAGYAVDSITIAGSVYVNNGVSDPPPQSSWLTITLSNVLSDTTISVSFAVCSDDTGVPDKYKHTVKAVAGSGGIVSPESQIVVEGSDAYIDIISDDNMAVDTISDGTTTYINNGLE